jgi:hypothetical protein
MTLGNETENRKYSAQFYLNLEVQLHQQPM